MKECITTADIAGYCNELTAWRIIMEVSEDMMSHKANGVNPFQIVINNDNSFSVSQIIPSDDTLGFEAPESPRNEASGVWSLAASVFYVVMGNQVMNGEGGRGQNEKSKIPYMRSELSQLSELVQRCLHYNPELRPSMQEVHDIAQIQFQHCMDLVKKGPKIRLNSMTAELGKDTDDPGADFWSEKMFPKQINNTTK